MKKMTARFAPALVALTILLSFTAASCSMPQSDPPYTGGRPGGSYDPSLDGWRPASWIPFCVADTITGFAFGNGRYVAVSVTGRIGWSDDGDRWHLAAKDFPATNSPATNFNSVTFGNGVFVAVGDGGRFAVSINGRDWVVRFLDGFWDLDRERFSYEFPDWFSDAGSGWFNNLFPTFPALWYDFQNYLLGGFGGGFFLWFLDRHTELSDVWLQDWIHARLHVWLYDWLHAWLLSLDDFDFFDEFSAWLYGYELGPDFDLNVFYRDFRDFLYGLPEDQPLTGAFDFDFDEFRDDFEYAFSDFLSDRFLDETFCFADYMRDFHEAFLLKVFYTALNLDLGFSLSGFLGDFSLFLWDWFPGATFDSYELSNWFEDAGWFFRFDFAGEFPDAFANWFGAFLDDELFDLNLDWFVYLFPGWFSNTFRGEFVEWFLGSFQDSFVVLFPDWFLGQLFWTFLSVHDITGVAWGGGDFVAVGVNARISHSTDGVHWSGGPRSEFPNVRLNDVAFGDGRFFVVGNGGHRGWSDAPGVNWRHQGPTAPIHTANITRVTVGSRGVDDYGNPAGIGIGVVFGDGRTAFATLPDTFAGFDADIRTFLFYLPAHPQTYWHRTRALKNGIAYGGGYFVAAGTGAMIGFWPSAEPSRDSERFWRALTFPEFMLWEITTVAALNGRFFVGNIGGRIGVSR